jgi:hypothetical protein
MISCLLFRSKEEGCPYTATCRPLVPGGGGVVVVLDNELKMPCQCTPSEISGSDGGEYEDGCLLGCCAVYSDESSPTFLPNDGGSKPLKRRQACTRLHDATTQKTTIFKYRLCISAGCHYTVLSVDCVQMIHMQVCHEAEHLSSSRVPGSPHTWRDCNSVRPF